MFSAIFTQTKCKYLLNNYYLTINCKYLQVIYIYLYIYYIIYMIHYIIYIIRVHNNAFVRQY